ncbi:MAG: IS110 family transposase [Thermoplasmata archaeon]
MDVHKDVCEVAWVNDEGDLTRRQRFKTTNRNLDNFIGKLSTEDKVSLECSTTGKMVYYRLKKAGMDVHMANPLKVSLIAKSKSKTDEKDAFILANLLRMGYLPESYVPDEEIEEIRNVVRLRVSLTHKMTAAKNQVHAILMRNCVEMRESDIFGKRGMKRIASLNLSPLDRAILDIRLKEIFHLSEQIDDVESIMASMAEKNECVKLLMTIPGVDFYSALVIVGEVGDFSRFPSKKHLASYAGLVPSVRCSGSEVHTGHITKRGPSLLRWILSVCANAAIKVAGPFKVLYNRLKDRKGYGKAIVAVAHKLIRVIYTMMIERKEYDHQIEKNVVRKRQRMRRSSSRMRERDLSTTVGSFSPKVLDRIKKEVVLP